MKDINQFFESNVIFGTIVKESKESLSVDATPDKSPYRLSKKKKFPEYLKHCIVKDIDNPIVKKYSYWGEAEIFVETIKKDGKNYYKVYMGDVYSSFENGYAEIVGDTKVKISSVEDEDDNWIELGNTSNIDEELSNINSNYIQDKEIK